MGDERERVDRLAVDEDVELDELRGAVADLLVVHRGVAGGAALELVEEVDDELGQRHLERHEDARRVEVFHVEERAASTGRELHERPDVRRRRDDREPDPRLLDDLDVARVRQLRRVVDRDLGAVEQPDPVLDRRRRGDEVEVELALETLLDDLHVEQAEEPAAEPEPEGDRALRLVGDARVVEVELLERVAQQRVVLAGQRVEAGEDEALGGLVAGQRLARRVGRGRDRVADLGVPDALEPGRDVADLTGHELRHRHELRPEEPELEELARRAARPSA